MCHTAANDGNSLRELSVYVIAVGDRYQGQDSIQVPIVLATAGIA
ncbi:MAG: hypothetical protein JWM99_3471 [Verrucomicrobiales bacterium]|nr:hypothetical protein [Verrucomicrobiales bacterium]